MTELSKLEALKAHVKELVLSLRDVSPLFWWVMVLKFTESFTYFALSQILVIYLRAEFDLTDIEAGFAYGCWGFMISFWSIMMSCVNDSLGIRRALLIGFSLEIVGNFLLAFARTRALVFTSLFGILPLGSCLGIPMLIIGVKRFSPEETKGFAFGLFYTVMNVAALASGPVVDLFNVGREPGDPYFEGSYITGNRMVIITCAISSICSFVFTKFYLVESPSDGSDHDVDEDGSTVSSAHSEDRLVGSDAAFRDGDDVDEEEDEMVEIQLNPIRDATEDAGDEQDDTTAPASNRNTKLAGAAISVASVKQLVRTKRFWRFVMLTLFLINLRAIFRHLDATFPTYLLRQHGNDIPKGVIYSINPFMIILLTPIVSAVATKVPDYDMIRNGSWITGLSALPLVLSSTVGSACLFVVLLSFGECVWSPASYNYAMAVAPDGREATFSALAAAPLFAAKIPVGLLGGYLLETYMPAEGPRQPKMLWLIILLATATSPVFLTLFERCVRQPRESDDKEVEDDEGDDRVLEGDAAGEEEGPGLEMRRGHHRLRTDSSHSEGEDEFI